MLFSERKEVQLPSSSFLTAERSCSQDHKLQYILPSQKRFLQKCLRVTVPLVHEISAMGHWQDQYNQLSAYKYSLNKFKVKLENLINKKENFTGWIS